MRGRRFRFGKYIFIGLLGVAISCIEPYNPPPITETVDILVVDGFLNSADSSAVVKLSKATALTDSDGPPPERNAFVRVEDETGNLFLLGESGNGIYSLEKMNLNPSLKYRLVITTSNDEEYISDFIELKISPAIDSITWGKSTQNESLAIYVNTHDASNNTKYYQWTFEETWEYTAGYFSSFEIKGGAVVPQDEDMYRCWISLPSTEIHVGTSVELREDVIRNFQLLSIPVGSPKLFRKFSLEVQQRALTKDAYDFWLQLKKTTESLGGLFDPLPSQVIGNLRSLEDTSQPVLGYFSGGYVSKKRIFIGITDLPVELRKITPPYCPVDTIAVDLVSTYPDMNIIGPYGYPFVEGYLSSAYSNCLDCRDEGGSTVRPDFWQ